MVDRYVAAHLRRLPIFKNYTDADLERLSSFCVTRRYEPNELVFRQDDIATGMYLVVSGRLVLIQRRADGSQVQLGLINANQFLNDAALRTEKRETASFIAVDPSIVILIPRDGYQQFLTGAMLPARRPAPVVAPVDDRPAAPGIPSHQSPPPPTANVYAGGKPAPLPTDRLVVPPQEQLTTPSKPQEASTVGSGNALQSGVDAQDRRFEGQRRDEQVVYMTRRHWWALFVHVWKPLLVFIVLTVGAVLLETPLLRVVVFGLGLILPGVLVVYYILEWRNDWLIVTNERLVHIRREILSWSTVVTDIPLQSVQGVNAETNGLLANILDFGNIEIQLAGQVSNLNETIVPAPEDFKNYVFQQRTKAVQMAERKRHDALIDRELDKMFNAPLAGAGQPAPAVATAPKPPAPEHPPLFAMRHKTPSGDTLYRKHLVVWWRGMVIPMVLVFVGIVIAFGGGLLPEGFSGLSGLFGLMLIALALSWAYLTDWLWRNDYVIMSNHDLTVIKNRPFLLDSFEDHILLDRIDNSIAETGGVIRSLLRYGDVRVNLIGDDKPKVFARMPYPRAMREEISERQSRARKAAAEAAELRSVQSALEAVQAYHNRLTANPVNPAQTPSAPPPTPNQPPFGGGRI